MIFRRYTAKNVRNVEDTSWKQKYRLDRRNQSEKKMADGGGSERSMFEDFGHYSLYVVSINVF